MAHKHAIPAAGVRAFRDAIREQLAVARRQVHDARTHDETAEARAHLNLVCDLLDALGWEDRDPEVAVPVEPIRQALRHHLADTHELTATHDVEQREKAALTARVIEALLDLIDPDQE